MDSLNEKYLPIGTIVLLKGGQKRLMITGFCIVADNDKTKMYDYSGCLYPEGVLTANETAVFNHDQIEKIFNVAYTDDEEIEFKKKLKEEISKVSNA